LPARPAPFSCAGGHANFYGSAYAAGQEQDKGTLRTGRPGDFVVLSHDLSGVPAESLRGITVGATIIGGNVAHNGGALDTPTGTA
jgi:predicted amidohydrolase YtcJ